MNDALRKRQGFQAIGRGDFATLMRSLNVPREYIGNNKFWISTPALATPDTRHTGNESPVDSFTNNAEATSSTRRSSAYLKKRKIGSEALETVKNKTKKFQQLSNQSPATPANDQNGAGSWLSLNL